MPTLVRTEFHRGSGLAFNYSEDINRAWLDSSGHKANILNDNFTEIGIATAEGTFNGHKTIFVVQMFGTPALAQLAGQPAVSGVQTKAEPRVEIVKEIQVDDRMANWARNFVDLLNDEIREMHAKWKNELRQASAG